MSRGVIRKLSFSETANNLGRSCLLIGGLVLATACPSLAQSSTTTAASTGSGAVSARSEENHYTWVEEFDGNSNSDGQVMLFNSTIGYVFGRHVLVDGGIPVYFVRATTTGPSGNSTITSFSALGDVFGQFRLSFPNPLLNFKTQLTGRAPTGNTSHGVSTGHATYDWTNRVDRGFGRWTPFLEVGVADSLPDTFIYGRPFSSYGNLAHFQIGAQYRVVSRLGLAASAFDVTPWGSQTTYSRVLGNGNVVVHGSSSIAADNGMSAGAFLSIARAMDLSVGYSRSTHYDLNTISFGIAVDMRTLLRSSGL